MNLSQEAKVGETQRLLVSTVKALQQYDYKSVDPENPEVLSYIQILEEIARNRIPIDLENEGLSDSIIQLSRNAYAEWEFAVERKQAHGLISQLSQDFFGSPQLARTYKFAEEEGIAAGVSSGSTMIFIGSGWVPESAIAHAHVHGCDVTCVDCNPEAIEVSRQLISRLGLGHKIQILHANGSDIDYGGYSHIAIAIMALPKADILRQVRATARQDASVICRTVVGTKELIYTPTTTEDIDGFQLRQHVLASNPTTIISSLVLDKTNAQA